MKTKQKIQFDKELIYKVDQIIIETGSYQAIELLLRTALLPYADYEQWRMGQYSTLSEVLESKKKAIIPLLNEAKHYVVSLKMNSEPVYMQQWEQNTHKNLTICPDNSVLSEYLNTQYFRQETDDQMDLFFDNQSLNLCNDLKRALISRNIKISSQTFQALYDIEPQNEIIKPAKILLDALINALEEENVSDPEEEMQYLLNELAPLARKTLAGQERDYMSLFWRRLAGYIDDLQGIEGLHTSVCFEQIPDWQAVIDSIEKQSSAKHQPRLFVRYVIALRKSGRQEQYIQAVCQYFWQFSEQHLELLINNDPMLKNSWHDFQDRELDNQWGLKNFPCWLLIKMPGISHHIISDTQAPEVFVILHKLIQTEITEKEQSITLRKQLKESHSGMLECYLKSK